MLGKEMTRTDCRAVAVIPAAGLGVRMGGSTPKQFLEVHGVPLLALTLAVFQKCRAVDTVIVVAPEGDVDSCRRDIVERYGFEKVRKVVAGGEHRQDSVRLGIRAAGTGFDLVLIHDGVRPMVEGDLIERVLRAAAQYGAVVAALPARETVKETDPEGGVTRTLDRSRIWLVQTPQAFPYGVIRDAHEKALLEKWPEATDDAALVEKLGKPVRVVEGSEKNIKVTTPLDLEWVRFLTREAGIPLPQGMERNGRNEDQDRHER